MKIPYSKTINGLKALLNDENCNNMNRSTIKGYIGELIVRDKLEKEKVGTILHIGNQSGYDLAIDKKNIKIDVKLSLYKKELSNNKDFKNWGWALKFAKNKGKKLKCTHFVCVALDDNLEVDSYYVIDARNINHFKKTQIKQFKNVIKGFYLTGKEMKDIIPKELFKSFNHCEELVKNKIIIKVKPTERISKYLNN